MVLRLIRIPLGYGNEGLEYLPGKDYKVVSERGMIHPILKIPKGDVADVVSLQDRGFEVEIVDWGKALVEPSK